MVVVGEHGDRRSVEKRHGDTHASVSARPITPKGTGPQQRKEQRITWATHADWSCQASPWVSQQPVGFEERAFVHNNNAGRFVRGQEPRSGSAPFCTIIEPCLRDDGNGVRSCMSQVRLPAFRVQPCDHQGQMRIAIQAVKTPAARRQLLVSGTVLTTSLNIASLYLPGSALVYVSKVFTLISWLWATTQPTFLVSFLQALLYALLATRCPITKT